MDSKQHKYELCVLEGMQKGSRQSLSTAQSHSIGNSFDCDIYLHDLSETNFRLEIVPGKLSMAITLASGEAVLDSKPMELGQKYKLSVGVPVRIGESLFSVENAKSCESAGASFEDALDAKASQTDAGSNLSEEEAEQGDFTVDPRKLNRLLRPQILIGLIGCGLVGSVFAAWRSGPIKTTFSEHIMPLGEYIGENVVGDLNVSTTENGEYIVSGSLPSKDEERKLKQALLTRSEDVVIKASVVADIEASVRDVFRTHGLAADIKTLTPGRLVVRTQTANVALLEQAELAANADVHGLEELSVVNTAPEVEKPVVSIASLDSNIDKEIQLIVVGDPSYVIATDDARYFLGSKLPTGHLIESISKDKVLLSKHGVTTELVM